MTVLANSSFRAMNTDVRFFSPDPIAHAIFAEAEQSFAAFEARFSRFRPDSELSQLNANSGRPFAASPDMIALLTLAREMHELTGGVFDPCVLHALEAAGYDRSFEQIADQVDGGFVPATLAHPFGRVEIDAPRHEVRLPAGARIDLGGIGKGYAVDRAAELLTPLRDFVIDAGGDIIARGHGPDGAGWVVAIADPTEPERDIAVLRLHDQALATSTTLRRRWRRGGAVRHHLIDPRTGRSAETDLVQVSVIAPTAVDADVFAKCALILGEDRGASLIEQHGYAACFVRHDNTTTATSSWPENASH